MTPASQPPPSSTWRRRKGEVAEVFVSCSIDRGTDLQTQARTSVRSTTSSLTSWKTLSFLTTTKTAVAKPPAGLLCPLTWLTAAWSPRTGAKQPSQIPEPRLLFPCIYCLFIFCSWIYTISLPPNNVHSYFLVAGVYPLSQMGGRVRRRVSTRVG